MQRYPTYSYTIISAVQAMTKGLILFLFIHMK